MKQYGNRLSRGFTPIKSGFTLIELLVVIAVLGILVGGILMALNIGGILDKANLTKANKFAASLERGLSINQVGKWSFDDQANPTKDTSGYGNDGDVYGASWDCNDTPYHIIGQGTGRCSLSFNETNQYVNIPYAKQLDITGPITVSAWVKSNQPSWSASWSIVSKYSQFILGPILPQKVAFIIHDGISWRPNGYSGLNWWTPSDITKWHHYVGVLNTNDQKIRLYGDGELKAEYNVVGKPQLQEGPIHIAHREFASIDTDHLKAKISDVQIYSEALTLSQIQKLYAQGVIKRAIAYK